MRERVEADLDRSCGQADHETQVRRMVANGDDLAETTAGAARSVGAWLMVLSWRRRLDCKVKRRADFRLEKSRGHRNLYRCTEAKHRLAELRYCEPDYGATWTVPQKAMWSPILRIQG